MSKRIIFIVMMLILTLSLAACTGQDSTITHIAVNNPVGENGEKLVFDHNEQNQIIFKGEQGLSYWTITKAGVSNLVSFEGNLPTLFDDQNGVRTYYFVAEGEQLSFKIYIKPEEVVEDNTIVMLALRYSDANATHHIGKKFNPAGMEVYAVERDGDIQKLHETLSEEQFAALFNDYGYSPITDDGFKTEISYPVSVTYGGITEDFSVYVAGGERPISTNDANIFDWIFVIPISYIMAFFGGLMGNSFALAILFTTIVVRTLAWPIYAKSNDMSLKMNIAQPDMQRVQMKYATRKDPASQQQMQMEMMQVYKKHGISMLGCLFPFLQMPIFIAMFGVVRRIPVEGGMFVESIQNTSFLGINLANGNDGVVGVILAGIVGATMYLLQWISQKKPAYQKKTTTHNNPQAAQTEKTMKYMMYFMIVMMVFASYQSNALALYWIFGNIYSLGQTYVNRKMAAKKHERMKENQILG